MSDYSVSPAGDRFVIPKADEYAGELERIEALVAAARSEGKEIVVVMGVGFVGAVMAAIVADTVDKKTGQSGKFVIGCQRPSTRSYWKIPLLNKGVSPVKAEDPEVDPMIERCVNQKKTLVATYNSDCLKFADCVVVDVQCDYTKKDLGNMRTGKVEMGALEATIKTIGGKVPPGCLTLIETTVAPGTTEFVAWPIMKKAFADRGIDSEPLLAHSFERVMPGKHYVSSIRDFWRVCSGCNAEARARVEKFLREVLNTEEFPLTVMDRPIESETTKIIENSFRATTLAFLDEWSLFAERNGVDLIKVINAIKARPTHCNMIFPGPGIGGYCLPKDGGLGYWAYKHILGFEDDIFQITTRAIDINDTRSLHVATLTRDALRNMGNQIAGAAVLLCARTSAIPDTAARKSSFASSPRWERTCASTTRTSNTGTSWKSRMSTPHPVIRSHGSSAIRTVWSTSAYRMILPRRSKGRRPLFLPSRIHRISTSNPRKSSTGQADPWRSSIVSVEEVRKGTRS